jgi:hypothetical protein
MHLSAVAAAGLFLLAAAPQKAPPPAPPQSEEPLQHGGPSSRMQAAEQIKRAAALESRDAGYDLLSADLSGLIDILSTSDGGFPFARLKWNVPGLQSYVDVPVVQFVNGLPVRFNAAVANHDVPYLMEYYAKEYQKAGLYIPPPDSMNSLGLGDRFFQLTGLDTDNLISYTVMLQPIGEKQTTVIMAQGYLQEWLKKKNKTSTDFAPLYPQALQVVRTHTEGMELISFSTKSPANQVMAFYDDVMPKGGYAPAGKGVWMRGQERIKVTAAKAPNEGGTGVMLERRLMSPGSSELP